MHGILVAIKVLSANLSQGVQEFMTEITTISVIEEHDNLVKLYGCCVEGGAHRILVYGYPESSGHCSIQFSWKIRTKICVGVARGLAFLHEDIKPNYLICDRNPGTNLKARCTHHKRI